MMVDTRIYGYTRDGGAYHPQCMDERPNDDDTIGALFYLHDEDPHGLTCDGCSEYIFEPVEAHRIEPDGTCEYGCFSYCGDTESCYLHGAADGPFGDPTVGGENGKPEYVDPLSTLWAIESTGHPAEED